MSEIAGYTYGTVAVAPSPISLDELEKLKATVLFGEETDAHPGPLPLWERGRG